MFDIDRLIGFMAIMQVPFMNDPDALAYIEEVKTVLKQAKARESGWISVKDRLPEKDGPYIVFGCSDAMKKFHPDCIPIWICDYSERNGGWYSIEMNRTIDYITHWMPLPEQPKEEDDEQTD